LQALIENWSLNIGHWQLNSAFPTTQGPFEAHRAIWPRIARARWRPRLQHPAADFPVAGSGESLPPGLQNVKEQARERRTGCILPPFNGTATFIFTFIFHLNSGGGNKFRQQPDWFF
jgi:hypothetical protein